ncbi:hypothetical protein TNCT1_19740 [Streptomyces sp. 1-11]|nr:hypothetical protein TNCT1_19740 [Streptomyces sp. 1-11]
MRRSAVSVDGISLPAVFAPGTRDLTVAAGTLEQGAGAAEYDFDAAVDDGADAAPVGVCWAGRSPAAAGAAGPEDRAQPAQASTATGVRRAVRASGRGSERTAHFSWGRGRGRVPRVGWDDSVTRLTVRRKGELAVCPAGNSGPRKPC